MPPITISTLKIEVLTTTPATKTSTVPTTTSAVTSTRITTVANKSIPKKETAELTTETMSTVFAIETLKFPNTAYPEGINEFTSTISPVNQTTLANNEINTFETIITTTAEPTQNVLTSIYNTTDIPSTNNGAGPTTSIPKIKSTKTEQIFELTTTPPMSMKNIPKMNEPELMRSITKPIASTRKFTDIITTTTKKYDIPILTTTEIKSTTISLTTEVAHSTSDSIVKEVSSSIPTPTNEVTEAVTLQTREATTTTTPKFKPKEIWIKPALKGEAIETKKAIHDTTKYRIPTNKDFTINTTPRTIIVSIIPTSVSYATFKKISLTTASYLAQKNNTKVHNYNKSTETLIKSAPLTSTTAKHGLQSSTVFNATASAITNEAEITRTTKSIATKPPSKSEFAIINETLITGTNITEKSALENTNFFTKTRPSTGFKLITKRMTSISSIQSTTPTTKTNHTHKYYITAKHRNLTTHKHKDDTTQPRKNTYKPVTSINKVTTEDPSDEEVFHILTEPEHITAVMGEKERGRTSMDLVSVVSIAGGIMMAVITVAVIIVMVERCKRPRYENTRKINDIHMQVMIDSNDPPPPYVRSIFQTPLPGIYKLSFL